MMENKKPDGKKRFRFPSGESGALPSFISRRTFLITAILAWPLMKLVRLFSGGNAANPRLIRPPFSREENLFQALCIRCSACVSACPTGVLKNAVFEFGITDFLTPVMDPSRGPCAEGCNKCSVACPTSAIAPYPVENKKSVRSGTAEITLNQCVVYSENRKCGRCIVECPTKAITGDADLKPLRVVPALCYGCGYCEFACNIVIPGKPAVILTASGRGETTGF